MQYGTTHDYTVNIDGTLGISDFATDASELIVESLPNNQFNISLITDYDERAAIAVYNVLGQTLAYNNIDKEGDRFKYELDMSYAPTGIYIIKMGDIYGNSYKTARIIVK